MTILTKIWNYRVSVSTDIRSFPAAYAIPLPHIWTLALSNVFLWKKMFAVHITTPSVTRGHPSIFITRQFGKYTVHKYTVACDGTVSAAKFSENFSCCVNWIILKCLLLSYAALYWLIQLVWCNRKLNGIQCQIRWTWLLTRDVVTCCISRLIWLCSNLVKWNTDGWNIWCRLLNDADDADTSLLNSQCC